jgi:virginiamycin B lyase
MNAARSVRVTVVCIAALIALLLPATASASISEYPVPTASSQMYDITAGPDGALWFTERQGNNIGRITTGGDISEFAVPTSGSLPLGITAGPDGAVWFTEEGARQIGRITTGGDISEFGPTASYLWGITAGPDGALWFADAYGGSIGRITTSGDITEYSEGQRPVGITAGPDGALWFTDFYTDRVGRIATDGTITQFSVAGGPFGITAGSDGALWFVENSRDKIGRITTGGSFSEFPITSGAFPIAIAAGPDGALWFTEYGTNEIGRMTTNGDLSEFPIPTADSRPWGIAAGPDGALWFTEQNGNKIGRITTDAEQPQSSTSQDAPAGGTVATNSTTSANDPVGTAVTTPVAGTVTIDEGATTTPDPSGYSLLGQEVQISAPTATAASPLVIQFLLDSSILPAGADQSSVAVFRNGVAIPDCDAGAGGAASPDPCVADRAAVTGGIAITVRTSEASTWNVGLHTAYAFQGFFSPIAAPPTLNPAQAGSAVSLRFSLGGNQGLGIFASGYPRSHQISCDSAATDLGDDAPTAGALSYDRKSQRYTYAWKTSRAWGKPTTCRQFVLRLNDGSTHRANFQFKR